MHLRIRELSRISAAVVMHFALASSCFAADVYDATTDFSGTTNTNSSAWSYRYRAGTTRDGNYPLLPNFGPAVGSWTPTSPNAWTLGGDNPEVGVNGTGSAATFTAGPSFVWPSGAMLMHPGQNSMAVVSWLSSSAAIATIQFSFLDLDNNAVEPYLSDGIDWYVERNSGGFTLASGTIANGGGTGILIISDVSVSPGDRINFLIAPKSAYNYDSTQFNATITATSVPEPSTHLLATLAALTLAVMRRRQGQTALP
ncbi:hypothetical protein GC170_19750 [bacterium]|nr:hypothetical protein [bacterium]